MSTSPYVVAPAKEFPIARPTSKKLHQQATAIPLLIRAGILGISSPSVTRGLLKSVKNYGFSLSSLAEMGKVKNPTGYAVHDDFGSMTFGSLADSARTTARYLRSLGIGQGDIVGILSRNSRYPMMSLCSLGYLGASPILLNPASSPVQIEKIMQEAGAHVLIADKEFDDVLSHTSATVIIADAQNDADAQGRAYLEKILTTEVPRVILHRDSRVIVAEKLASRRWRRPQSLG